MDPFITKNKLTGTPEIISKNKLQSFLPLPLQREAVFGYPKHNLNIKTK